MNGTRARSRRSPRDHRVAHTFDPASIDAGDARLCSRKKPTAIASHRDSRNISTGSSPMSSVRRGDNKKNSAIRSKTSIPSRTHVKYDSKRTPDSRDPIELAPDEDNSCGRSVIKETRDKGETRKGRRKKNKQAHTRSRNSSTARRGRGGGTKKGVSFAEGDSGNAVTSVKQYKIIYSDEEKAACFYSERDLARFRAEEEKAYDKEKSEDEQSPEYIKAANDFYDFVNDMWNSLLYFTYYSIKG